MNFLKTTTLLVLLVIASLQQGIAQRDTTKVFHNATVLSPADVQPQQLNKKKLAFVLGSEAVLYGGTLYGLNELWYKDYPRSGFHFFNDNAEWLQMDKCGHFITSYYVGRVGKGLLNYTGMERKKAVWYGGVLGSVFLTTVEVLDGYSSQWGFSVGDFAANTFGSLACIAQQLRWKEQRIVFKYSFMQSDYAQYRPEQLGKNLQENMLKDYNGQTYWLSVNVASFLKKETRFPKFINVAFGYGADGMTGAEFNPVYLNYQGTQLNFERYRQFYVSLDVDLTRIKTKYKLINTLFNTIGFIKFPFPAVEFNKYGVKGLLVQ